MFVDYYLILEIPFGSSLEEIKVAYRKLAIKWHPDKNPGIDTVSKMQEINEAYIILKDPEAKKRFDKEYSSYKIFENIHNESWGINSDNTDNSQDYIFKDDLLKKWMENARKQAEKLAKQSQEEFRNGIHAAGIEIFEQVKSFLIVGIFFSIIFLFAKSCK
jgi:curved DNA-binding protein CbpA